MLSNIEDMRWKEPTPIQMQVQVHSRYIHDDYARTTPQLYDS